MEALVLINREKMIKKIRFVILLIVGGCAYDNEADLYGTPACPPDEISFSQDIKPIIQTNCAIANCHVDGRQLPSLETFEQIQANAQRIKSRTGNGTMPPPTSGKSLSESEIELISCWVDAGAVEN
jgi:uncharacterized membrane protein